MTHKKATRNRGLILMASGWPLQGRTSPTGEAALLVVLGVILGLVGLVFLIGAGMMRPD